VRPRRGALAALATMFLSVLAAGFAGSAAAGGPTSVLLVVPGEGRTASLYNSDPEYDQLARLVGAFGPAAGSTTAPKTSSNAGPSGTDDASGPGVTLTWLMHDVNVWRVDRVYLAAEGGPWISSQTTMDGGDLFSQEPRWHTAGDGGKELATLLDGLGVGLTATGTAAVAGNGNVDTGQAAPIPANGAPATTGATTTEPSSGLPGPDGWIWGLAGLLLGTALTLALRRRPVAAAPDAAADEAPATGDDGGTLTEVDGWTAPRPAGDVGADDAADGGSGRPRVETLSSHSPPSRSGQ
jgi:hypothetical protein